MLNYEEIMSFAEKMQEKMVLKDKEYPVAWQNRDDIYCFFHKLTEEYAELVLELNKHLLQTDSIETECVDVANCAMMLHYHLKKERELYQKAKEELLRQGNKE